MREIFLSVIRKGGYDLAGMLRRIDEYHISGKLTDAERDELVAAARDDATPGVDASAEVQRLWAVVRELIARVVKLEGGAPDEGGEGEVKAFVQPTGAHDAYYADAVVSYNGKVYKCIVPSGVACVWSPDVAPGYWQEQ